jgi:Rha family phage regulatory protein
LTPTDSAARARSNFGASFYVNAQDNGDRLVTDTRAVAIAFGKQHKDVLRIIERMRRSEHAEIAEHGQRNFAPSSYVNAQGKRQPMYRMTAKGLSELTMGFTDESGT